MSYEPKTERVDLGGELYAVLFTETRHGTQRAVNSLTRPFLKYPDGKAPKLTLQGEDQKPTVEGATAVEVDLGAIDYDAVNDAIIVGQVKEWSFGEVNQASLDSLPEGFRAALVAKCNELYGAAGPLVKGGGGN